MQSIRIDSALICDMMRREDTGKDILIGIYTGSINLQSLPAKLSLTFWLVTEALSEGKTEFVMRFRGPHELIVVQTPPIPISIEPDSPLLSGSITIVSDVTLQIAGDYFVEILYTGGSGQWEVIKKAAVTTWSEQTPGPKGEKGPTLQRPPLL